MTRTAAEKRLRLAREQFMKLGPLDPGFAEAFNEYVIILMKDASPNVEKIEPEAKRPTTPKERP